MRVEFPRDFRELPRLFERIVHVFDQDEFERDHAPVLFGKFLRRGNELRERIFPVHGHDAGTHLVRRAVQADCEAELHRVVRELADFRHDAARGNRDAPRADAQAPGRVRDAQRAHRRLAVHQRLAHAHDDDVVEIGEAGFARSFVGAFPADEHQLRDDFPGLEIALPPGEPARAKAAALRAADLRRDADRFAGTRFGGVFLRSAQHHAFDERAVAHAQQKFLRGVARLFAFRDEFRRREIVNFREPRARSRGQVRHLLERGDAFFVNPVENLRGAERLLALRLQRRGERFLRLGKDERSKIIHIFMPDFTRLSAQRKDIETRTKTSLRFFFSKLFALREKKSVPASNSRERRLSQKKVEPINFEISFAGAAAASRNKRENTNAREQTERARFRNRREALNHAASAHFTDNELRELVIRQNAVVKSNIVDH